MSQPVSLHSGEEAPSVPAAVVPKRRARTPVLLTLMTITAVGATLGWRTLTAGTESTDDAQAEAHVINVSARVSGLVLAVRVRDNQEVEAGQVLVELDPADYQVKVAVARADLAATKAAAEQARTALQMTEKTAPANIREARGGVTAANSTLDVARASIRQGEAELVSAEARRTLAQANLERSRTLLESKALAVAEVDARQAELDTAVAGVDQAKARLAAARASLSSMSGNLDLARGRFSAANTAEEQIAAARSALGLADARVEQAEATLKAATLNASYAVLKAPRRGVISNRNVEEGQMVGPERPLLSIVPLDDVWVVANFKENQLENLRVNQPATVRFDAYGRHEFRGHVESVAGGTGARFALLPPDNATGNFVKVVQRVPVLIKLDSEHEVTIRPGMSADVSVQTR